MSVYIATWIDEYSFGYYCESCGREHVHGCCRDFITNRTENRSRHCDKIRGNVDIQITPATTRRLNRRNMKIYQNSLTN